MRVPAGFSGVLIGLLLVSSFAVLATSGTVVAATPGCGATITGYTTLKANIGPCSGTGLVLGGNGVTLDCAHHTISGGGGYIGILVSGRSNVVVRNCNVVRFVDGFHVENSPSTSLIGNAVVDNYYSGMYIYGSPLSYLHNNHATGSTWGFYIDVGNDQSLFTSNAASDNFYGFYMTCSNYMKGVYNTANDNAYGFFYGDPGCGGFPFHNSFNNNVADYNGYFGFEDASSGPGTSGTGNFYDGDVCVSNYAGSSPSGLCAP